MRRLLYLLLTCIIAIALYGCEGRTLFNRSDSRPSSHQTGIIITSDPAGAKVEIDGIFMGLTPLHIGGQTLGIEPGERKVVVSKGDEHTGFSLETTAQGKGVISREPDKVKYSAMRQEDQLVVVEGEMINHHVVLDFDKVLLTASADPGWEFNRWAGDLSGTENPVNVLIDDDKNITAVFSYMVSGKVEDGAGEGIGGAMLSFSDGYSSVTTEDDGTWSKAGLNGSVTIAPSKGGYAFSPENLTVEGPATDINFKGTYEIAGYIIDGAGNGIAGAEVNFSGKHDVVVTDEDGHWEKMGLSGNVTVTPDKEGYSFAPESLEVEGPTTEVNFVGGYKIDGIVMDGAGNGIAGVEIHFSKEFTSVTTDEDGSWSKGGLYGTVKVAPNKDDYVFEPSSLEVEGPSEEVVFTGGYGVSGVIKDGAGNGIEGIAVTFSRGHTGVITNEEGRWSKGGLSGAVTITPEHEVFDFIPERFEVKDSSEEVDFIGGYRVSGVIEDGAGVAIEGVEVTFSGGYPSVMTAEDGSWISENLTGTVMVTPDHEDFGFLPESIEVDGPSTEVSFVGGYQISGVVTDEASFGIPGVEIAFSRGYLSVITGEDGVWSRDRLTGVVVVTPHHEDYAFTPESLEVLGPNTDIDFTGIFTGTYDIEGLVKDEAGFGISGVEIVFSEEYDSAMTDSDGRWSKTDLEGSVLVTPWKDGYVFTPEDREVKGPTTAVNFMGGYHISGRVRDELGVAIEGVEITFGDGYTPVITGGDGSWSKSNVSKTVTVTPGKEGYKFIPESRQVEGPSTEIDFTGRYTISGSVVDGAGNGVEGVEITFSGGYSSVLTGDDGSWSKGGLSGSVTVTPSKDGYVFAPESIELRGPSTEVDFTGNEEPIVEYILTMQMEGQGAVTPKVGSHNYEEGTVVDLTATPADGYEFKEWVGEVANVGSANTTVVMNKNKVVKAVFEKEDDNGYIPGDPGEQTSHNVNGVDFNMRLAPASTFPTGTDDSGSATVDHDFWVAETQVTYELWYEVRMWAEREGYTFANAGMEGSTTGGGSWPNYNNIGNPPTSKRNEPVTMVSWRDSIVWTNALTEMLGFTPVYTYQGNVIRDSTNATACDNAIQEDTNGFRLPTSDEWELAARYKGSDSSHGSIEHPAGSGNFWTPGNYASGATANYDNAAASQAAAWYSTNSGGKTQDVGQKPSGGNGLEVFDMSGNVWEWCFTQSGSNRVSCGGSWRSTPDRLQVGDVGIFAPGNININVNFGLRFLRTHEDYTVTPPTQYTLTMEKTGQGTVTPAEGTHSYEDGSVVLINAQPASGWKFVRWEGDVASPDASQVVMDRDRTVRAVFEETDGPGPGEPGEQTSHTAGGVDFNMRLAPASTFPTGTDDSGSATVDDDFWVAEIQVTYELWYEVRMWALDNGYTFANVGREGSHGSTGQTPSNRKKEPVTEVSWYDSIVWCNALSQMIGYDPVYTYNGLVIISATGIDHRDVVEERRNGFRLPTSNEWELAARFKGSDSSHGAIEYPSESGNYWTPGNYASGATADYTNAIATQAVAWYRENSGDKTQDVGQKPLYGNGLGVFDMSGNVREWTFTLDGDNRLNRGGSWNRGSDYLPVGRVNIRRVTLVNNFYGFRFLRTDGPTIDPPTTYTLTMHKTGQGDVEPDVGDHTYDDGTVVNLEATPAVGWKFKEWIGDVADVGSANTTVVMDKNKAVTVVFEVEEDFEGGIGSEEDPYLIATPEQLNNVRNHLDKHFRQIDDIDLSVFGNWDPIGIWYDPGDSENKLFSGFFDGNGYTIINLSIDRSLTDAVGLFAVIDENGTITNINLQNIAISGKNRVGGLVGYNWGSIIESNATGIVIGNDWVGGLVGDSTVFASIKESYMVGTITGNGSVGGLAGYNRGSVTDCYATGTVTGLSPVGGLVGNNGNNASITKSYATVAVTGRGNGVGGLVGNNGNNASITESYATGTVTGESNHVGGFAGYNGHGFITKSYATGTVKGNKDVGGFVGYNYYGFIADCYATGAVTGEGTGAGGLAGRNAGGSITESYAIGDVTGNEEVGGLVGKNWGDGSNGSITKSYAVGTITGNERVGGLVGRSLNASVEYSYYNQETTGQSDTSKGTPKTTSEMIQQSTFEPEWDFDSIWGIEESSSYPYLQWQEPGTYPYPYGNEYIPKDPGEQTSHNVNGINFNMRLAPASTFPTGRRDDGEGTVDHDFWVAETQVTYELWYEVRMWAQRNGYTFANAGRAGNAGLTQNKNEPITTVNWYDSIVWCNALSEKKGLDPVYTIGGNVLRDSEELKNDDSHEDVVDEERNGFRLPTSMEWELAARYKGSDSSHGAIEFPVGSGNFWTPGNYASGARDDYNNAAATQAAAWYEENSGRRTQDVGQKPFGGNRLGLFDMSGNVWEWCFTYRKDISSDRIFRGGGWDDRADRLRVGFVSSGSPIGVGRGLGFRIVRAIF